MLQCLLDSQPSVKRGGLPPQFSRVPPSASGKITQAYARCNKNEIAGLTVSEEGMKLSSKGKLN